MEEKVENMKGIQVEYNKYRRFKTTARKIRTYSTPPRKGMFSSNSFLKKKAEVALNIFLDKFDII
jgi:hypothetical protein